MLKAVLFDMDGVLYDSMPMHARAWEEIIQSYQIPCTREEFYMFEGRTGVSTINLLFQRTFQRDATKEEIQEIYDKKTARFRELDKQAVMPGAMKVLSQVKASGLTIVLVTGSGQLSLLDNLNTNFPGYFQKELMVTAYDVIHGKPHPEPYLQGLKKANVNPQEAIVVENAPLGVQSAVAAGIFTVAVNTGPLDDNVLWNAGANILFSDMQIFADNWPVFFKNLP